jgi:membrane-associated phospholipid phosphatase
MKNSISLLRDNRIYFLGFFFFLCTGFLLLFFNGKAASFISLNTWHPFWMNVFFINYTFIGDGIFAIALIGICLFYFKKKQQGLALLYAFLLSGAAVQIIKNLVSAPRPRLFFEPGQYLFFVDDVSLANNSSFPSGHTATAFAIATVLILLMKNKRWQLPVLTAAVLVGYSRIYLAQHFLLDVLIGAVIGSVAGFLGVYITKTSRSIRFSFRKMHRIENNRTILSPGAMQRV